MKAIYAKDIKAMVKQFDLNEAESDYLNDIAEAINKERTDLCEDIQMTLLYGSYSKSKRNAIRALLVYFGAKAQKENELYRKHGLQAIQDTFNRAFDAWKGDYKYLTELVLVLNHKIFHHYVEKGTEEENEKASLYNELWNKANDYALENLQGEQADYFYHLTD